jgi:hypothetical protein
MNINNNERYDGTCGSHCGEDVDDIILDFNAMWSIPTFRRNIMSPSSEPILIDYVSETFVSAYESHGVTTQNKINKEASQIRKITFESI